MSDPAFVFASCQAGAEKLVKAELATSHPTFRPAFSRPGFITFKVASDHPLDEKFELRSVFARTYGFSLGKLQGTDGQALAREVWQLVGDRQVQAVHVWERDAHVPGEHDFEPSVTPLAREVAELIVAARGVGVPPAEAPNANDTGETPAPRAPLPHSQIARRGDRILDVVLVEPNEWWVGWHRAVTIPQRWPGGIFPGELPEEAVSRAYLKMAEALAWSQFPAQRGDTVAEIGSSPGGSCQVLLEHGWKVIGVDPGEMDESLLEHPNFTHVRRRASEVKHKTFEPVRWLATDINMPPSYTLDVVEEIVKRPSVHIRGLLLTLKLPETELAREIADYISRIRGWGFNYVKARQLSFNKQEICVAALRKRALRRERHLQGKSEKPLPADEQVDEQIEAAESVEPFVDPFDDV